MASVIKTVLTYPLNGTTTDFTIPFEYLARKFVVVTLVGTDRHVLTLNTDYRFATRTTISTTKAWGPSDGYESIEIRRVTSATERLVDFTDGSILRAYDLNVAQIQTMHVAEEARDLTADTIGVNNDGNLDARGRRIVNAADAKDPGDLVTLRQLQNWNESALNSAKAAKVSETNAKESEDNAKASEVAASTSERNSKASEDLAHKWAQNPENMTVDGNEYSAYHHARKAASSARAASASETAAGASEANAKTSELNAAASESKAKADADRAEKEADKLGNFNELAALIESADENTHSIRWKANDIKVLNPASADQDWRSYISRWETNGAHGTLEAFRNANDGGLMIQSREDRYSAPSPFFFVGDGTFNTGRLMTRLDAGKDPVAFPSYFSQSLLLEFHGHRCRYYSNGDIVWEAGNNIFANAHAQANSLGSAFNWLRSAAVYEVYLGGQEWWLHGTPHDGSRIDWAVGGGSVCTGYTQSRTGASIWLDGMFHRKVWMRYGSGERFIIVST